MTRNRIAVKLGATIIFLFLIVLFPLGFVLDQVLSGFYYGKVSNEIDRLSSRYSELLAQNQNPMVMHMVGMIADFSQIPLVVIDSSGQVLVSSVQGDSQGLVLERDIHTLSKGEIIQREYTVPVTEERYLVSGKPVIQDGQFLGGVYVLSSIQGIDESVQAIRNLLLLSGVGALFLALGFTWVLSSKLSSPLIQMEMATRKIAKGNLDTRVKLTSRDEMGSLAAAINDLAYELKRYRDSRSEFFASISHELRTPITYLEGYAQILKEGLYQNEQEKQSYLTIIQQEAGKLTRMINDLFDIAKMEAGKVELNVEWVDLNEVLDAVLQKIELKAKEKGLSVEDHTIGNIPLVYADGLRMEQILVNLLENAIRYTEKGSIKVNMKMDASHIKISIEDTGIGIPKDELPYIFERFYRVEKSRSKEYGGTGLGLSIVKQLVELQSGTIDVWSQPGIGTKFEVTFPANQREVQL
jgi:signal transduction histidine kinase